MQCSVDGLQGLWSAADRLVVLETCGTTRGALGAQLVPAFPTVSVTVAASGASAVWPPLTAQAGQYRLCWCTHGGAGTPWSHRCSTAEDFVVDAGSLVVYGPQTLPRVMATRGLCGNSAHRDASFLETVDNVESPDACRRLCEQYHRPCDEACGHLTTVSKESYGDCVRACARGACAGAEFVDQAPRTWPRNPTNQHAALGFEGETVGQCRLFFRCFPYSNDMASSVVLLNAAHFRFREATCVAGSACEIPGATNLDWNANDAVWLLDTCSTPTADPRQEPGVPETEGARGKGVVSGGAIRFPGLITAQGGQYRLCWCGHPEGDSNSPSCDGSAYFTVDLGALTVVGPYAGQAFTCVSGRRCEVDALRGQSLTEADVVMVLETCGTLAGLPFPGGRGDGVPDRCGHSAYGTTHARFRRRLPSARD
jgi:hypothetical protein